MPDRAEDEERDVTEPEDQRPAPSVPDVPRPRDRGYYGAGWTEPTSAQRPYGQQQPVQYEQAYGQQQAYAQQQPYAQQQQYGQQAPYGQQQPFAQQQQYSQQAPYGQQQTPTGGQRSAPAQPGTYGAPWTPPPPRRERRPSDPARAFAPGAVRSDVASAAIAVALLYAVHVVICLTGLVGNVTAVRGPEAIALFGTSVASAFPFMVGAFLMLAFLTPIVRRSPLPAVLRRSVLAGAGGTVAMALVGIATAAFQTARGGPASYFVVDVFTRPLGAGVEFTAILVGTSAAAWLWLGRPTRAPRHVPGAGLPGTPPPPDAVPPATVVPPTADMPESQPPQQPQQPVGGQLGIPPMPPGAVPGPYGPSGGENGQPTQHWSTTAPTAQGDGQGGR